MAVQHANRYDVIVVGGRVAGASTAMLLARRGHRVLVVDRDRPDRDTLSTHAFMRPGIVQLERWGVLDQVVAAGTPPVRRVTFHYGDDAVPIDIDEPLYAPRRTVLDPILVAAARAAGVEFRYGVHVAGVLRADDGRVIGIAGRDADGARFTAHAAVTVGADGRRSLIAREVGAAVTRNEPTVGAVIYGYWQDVDLDGYEWCFNPRTTAGLMPTNDGLTCVWVAAPAARLLPDMRADREAALHRVLAETTTDVARRVRAATRYGVLRGAIASSTVLRRPWGPGWALVGDAGCVLDPVTAQGMSDAVRDAELLARALDDALSERAPESAALIAYEQLRDELSAPIVAATAAVSSYTWNLPEVQRQHRVLSRGMQQATAVLTTLRDPVPAAA